MKTAAKKRRPVDERRAQLLELGIELFASRAYDEVAIDDIARAAGISKGLLYHYFGSKRDFYIETIRYVSAGLLRVLAPDPTLPPLESVKTGLLRYLDYVEGRADAYAALLHGGIGADPEVLAMMEQTRGQIVKMMLDGMGLTDPRPAYRLSVRSWLGAVEAACLEWLAHREITRDALVQLLSTTLYAHVLGASQIDPDATVASALQDALAYLKRAVG